MGVYIFRPHHRTHSSVSFIDSCIDRQCLVVYCEFRWVVDQRPITIVEGDVAATMPCCCVYNPVPVHGDVVDVVFYGHSTLYRRAGDDVSPSTAANSNLMALVLTLLTPSGHANQW